MSRKLYDQIPQKEFVGLDWGFNAPTAASGNKYHNGRLYSRQIVYLEELEDSELAAALKKGGVKPDKKYMPTHRRKKVSGHCAAGVLQL